MEDMYGAAAAAALFSGFLADLSPAVSCPPGIFWYIIAVSEQRSSVCVPQNTAVGGGTRISKRRKDLNLWL